jgi:hypothetical protein
VDEGWPVGLPGERVVQLGYWGRWIDGQWWGYLWWWTPAQTFRPAEAELAGQQVLCCGWAWSTSVRPLSDVDYAAVPRIELPVAPDAWPDPAYQWATRAGRKVRHQGLMGHPLGSPVTELPNDASPARRGKREPGTGQTLAERVQNRPTEP